jgi:hypothetical protein
MRIVEYDGRLRHVFKDEYGMSAKKCRQRRMRVILDGFSESALSARYPHGIDEAFHQGGFTAAPFADHQNQGVSAGHQSLQESQALFDGLDRKVKGPFRIWCERP